MGWWIPRALANGVCVMLGAFAGAMVMRSMNGPVWPVVVGALVGTVAWATVDAVEAHRFLCWLRARNDGGVAMPRGAWRATAQSVERELALMQSRVDKEGLQLEQFLSAIDASSSGVILLDASDQIVWCNSAAADHFALNPSRDVGQRVTNLVRSPDFVSFLQAERSDQGLTLAAPGTRGTLNVLVREYGDGRRLVMSQDVTERERSDLMRRDFVANVSHEIRTPLTVLSGFIETMASLQLTEVERKRVLELMSQQTLRMKTLVNGLLTLAQLEGSPRPPTDRWVSVDRLMQQVLAEAQALSADRHSIEFDEANGAQLSGAESEIVSALGNLVNNAVRYTPAGGAIRVCWAIREDGAGEFRVIDTGVGIARELLPRITERFYRVDGSRSRDTGGSGLGLSIVKHVMQRHGGELDIRSEPDKGSCFRLTFPASRVRLLETLLDPRVG